LSKKTNAVLPNGVTPAPAGHKLRELIQTVAQVEDKLLHFVFLAAAGFVIWADADEKTGK